MKFSLCGRLLATAGQDNIIRVWVLRNHLSYFNTLRDRYNLQSKKSSMPMDENMQNQMQDIENDLCSSTTVIPSCNFFHCIAHANPLKLVSADPMITVNEPETMINF